MNHQCHRKLKAALLIALIGLGCRSPLSGGNGSVRQKSVSKIISSANSGSAANGTNGSNDGAQSSTNVTDEDKKLLAEMEKETQTEHAEETKGLALTELGEMHLAIGTLQEQAPATDAALQADTEFQKTVAITAARIAQNIGTVEKIAVMVAAEATTPDLNRRLDEILKDTKGALDQGSVASKSQQPQAATEQLQLAAAALSATIKKLAACTGNRELATLAAPAGANIAVQTVQRGLDTLADGLAILLTSCIAKAPGASDCHHSGKHN